MTNLLISRRYVLSRSAFRRHPERSEGPPHSQPRLSPASTGCPILSSLIGKGGVWTTTHIEGPTILSDLLGKGGVLATLLAFSMLTLTTKSKAQAEPAGIGPGTYLALGITASAYNSAYGQQKLAGPALYLDANLFRKVGGEIEVRTLNFHNQQSLKETTILAGPRISTHGHTWRPYTKLLAGRGSLIYPYSYAKGTYFVAAPGAGLDLRLGRGRYLLRLIDFEYQLWPGFTFSTAPTGMHPWGISTGISVRLY